MNLRRYRHIIMTLALASASAAFFCASAAPPKGWEPVKSERSDAKSVIKETELEIKAASGMIFITTSHPVQIKIFTILGRLVSSETVPAGKSQLNLAAHGIYMVKVGEIVCKVAV